MSTEDRTCICCGLNCSDPPNERGDCGCWLCYICLMRDHDSPESHAECHLPKLAERAAKIVRSTP